MEYGNRGDLKLYREVYWYKLIVADSNTCKDYVYSLHQLINFMIHPHLFLNQHIQNNLDRVCYRIQNHLLSSPKRLSHNK